MSTGSFLDRIFANRKLQSFIGSFLTLVAIVSLVFSWKASTDEQASNERLKAYVKCQAEWTTFFYQAIQSGRSANQRSAEALDKLVQTVSTARSREETAAALDEYKAARAEQLKSQADNPLPEAPKEACQVEE